MPKFKITEIRGVIPALLTPFDREENLNEEALRKLVNRLLDEGAHGLYLTGSTGEGFLMDLNERKRAVEVVIDESDGRVPIIVHVGAISTKLSLELTHHASSVGADAISSVPPFYFKFTESEIIEYYRTLAAATELPMIVYNIPLAGIMGYDTILKLANLPNVKGIKYTSSTHYEITMLKKDVGENFMIYSGSDEMALSGYVAGADGIIGSTYNALGDTFLKIHDNFEKGDIAKASEVMDEAVITIMQILSYGSLMSVLKVINRWLGVDCGYARSPFFNFTIEEEEEMKSDFLALSEQHNLKHIGFINYLKKNN